MTGPPRCAHPIVDDQNRIAEGFCASCDLPLERDGKFGRCPCCRFGWQITPTEITLSVEIVFPRRHPDD